MNPTSREKKTFRRTSIICSHRYFENIEVKLEQDSSFSTPTNLRVQRLSSGILITTTPENSRFPSLPKNYGDYWLIRESLYSWKIRNDLSVHLRPVITLIQQVLPFSDCIKIVIALYIHHHLHLGFLHLMQKS